MTVRARPGSETVAGNDGAPAASPLIRHGKLWPAILLVSLPMPYAFQIGSLQLSLDRIVLMIMVLPCLFKWAGGVAGRIRFTDIILLLFWFWTALSLTVVEGLGTGIEAGGIGFIETVGAFLMARVYIRTADDFRAMVKLLFWIVAFLAPFAVYETLTGHNLLLELTKKIYPVVHGDIAKDARWGLDRVTATLSHPILFGIFCGSAVALTHYVLGYQATSMARRLKTLLVSFVTFLSLSSGPISALAAQLGLMTWDRVFRRFPARWIVLASGLFTCVVAIEIAANRSTPQIFIDYFSFDKHTAYNRLRIWEYGKLSVANNFWFGVGFGEWVRPYFMSASIDMFWLVPAVQNGFMAGMLLHVLVLSMFLTIALKRGLGPRASAYRTGYLICMVAFYLAGWSVHYWKSIYLLYIFLLASGAWLLDAEGSDEEAGAELVSRPATSPERVRFRRDATELKVRHSSDAPQEKQRGRSMGYGAGRRAREKKATE